MLRGSSPVRVSRQPAASDRGGRGQHALGNNASEDAPARRDQQRRRDQPAARRPAGAAGSTPGVGAPSRDSVATVSLMALFRGYKRRPSDGGVAAASADRVTPPRSAGLNAPTPNSPGAVPCFRPWRLANPEFGEQQLRDLVGLLEMGIAGGDHGLDPQRLIFAQSLRDRLGIADQRRARAAAHQADAGPQIGRDLELVAAAAAMQRDHALLADRIGFLSELSLRGGDRFVREIGDELVGDGPGFVFGLAHDQMHAQAELDLATLRCGARAHVLDLLGDLFERLAPGQIDVRLLGRELVRRLGGAAEPDGHVLLHRRKQLPRALRPAHSGRE